MSPFPDSGVFLVVQKRARTGRNPDTGAAIKIPARKAGKFSISSGLKQGRCSLSLGKCAMTVVHFFVDATPARSRPA
jgi:hypothetical protein